MSIRCLAAPVEGPAELVTDPTLESFEGRWLWVDIDLAGGEPVPDWVAGPLGFEPVQLRRVVEERGIPKLSDFGHQLLVVVHSLAEDRFETHGVTCLLTETALVTLRVGESTSIDALWEQLQRSEELAAGGSDELLARLSDVLCRRFVAVLQTLDELVEELTDMALQADPGLLGELVAVRADTAHVRQSIHPQRELFDQLRHLTSPVITEGGQRRFSDVFDVADRTARGLESARTGLAEALDAYRGAEARQATEVTRVLTVYAAVMFPLSLVAGFYGMNFQNLPGLGDENGWLFVTALMVVIAAVSLGIFVAVGWIRPLSPKKATSTLGRGLFEASKAPVQVVGALYDASTSPLRIVRRVTSRSGHESIAHDDDTTDR